MKYLLAFLLALFFQSCAIKTVHYDYASTSFNGADLDYAQYTISEPEMYTAEDTNKTPLVTPRKELVRTSVPTQANTIVISPKKTEALPVASIDPLKRFSFLKSTKIKENDFAIVIGISSYSNATPVPYANNSALAFSTLAHTTFGIPKENIISLIDDKATSGELKSKLHLIKELADPDSTIYFYFAGHGLPSKDGDTFILPYDMSADAIDYEESLKLQNIYRLLSSAEAKKIIVVIDSCFSGKDDSGALLYEGVAPVLMVKKTQAEKKMTIFTAGGPKDFANALNDEQQRMFTYYFITAINEGLMDAKSIYRSIRSKVKRASLYKGIGYKQVPQIDGELTPSIY